MSTNVRTLRIGTRGSLLALTQTEWVAARLRALYPDVDVQIVTIQTTGDMRRDMPFAAIGTKGMFVKEIEQALLDERVDIGVHSLKDMPSELPHGLQLACVPEREDPRDALISVSHGSFAELPDGSVIGTSSLRRQSQMHALGRSFRTEELRGNLDTRLSRLEQGRYQAIVVACAGLIRLGMQDRITEALSPDVCMPAVGQGALAMEIRIADDSTHSLLSALNHADSADAVSAERGFLAALEGGCTIPAGALATMSGDILRIEGAIIAPDGSQVIRDVAEGHRNYAANIGAELAAGLLRAGGRELLKG